MRRTSRLRCVLGAILLSLATASPARACPMCKLANETESRLPRAYMYSILFMLSMPATLATCFGIGFYRLSRKAAQDQQFVDFPAVDPGADHMVDPAMDRSVEPGTGDAELGPAAI